MYKTKGITFMSFYPSAILAVGRTPSPSRSAGKQDTTSSTIAGWFTRSPSPSPSLPSSSSSSSSSGSASPRTLPPAVHSQLSPAAAAGPQKQQTPQTIPNQQQHIMGVGTSLLPQRPSSIAGLSTCFPMSGAELVRRLLKVSVLLEM